MRLMKLLLMFLFCAQTSLVWAGEKSHAQLVDELIVKSGTQRQVEQIPEVVKVSVEQRIAQDTKMPAEGKAIFKDALAGAFDAATMLKFVKDYVAAGLTDEDMNTILVWLNSPLGQKITRLEEESSSGEAYQKMQQFALELQSKKPDEKRMAVLERFDQAAHMTETSIKMKMDVAMAMSESMACAMGCKNFSQEQTLKQLEQARPQLEQGSKKEMIVSALFTYQSLTIDELEQYINFYGTTTGQKYMKVMVDGLSASIKDASQRLGKKLGESLKDKKQALENKN